MLTTDKRSSNLIVHLLDFKSSFSNMSLLAELNAEVLDYAKSMPERSVADDLDFEVWGKGFCEKMVSFVL